MSIKPFVITPADRPRPLEVAGEHITVLASRQATRGYEIFLQDGPEGSGAPPHKHDWDESFFVIEGQIEFGFGEQRMTANPGALVHIPAGTVHWFRFCAGGGQMLSVTGAGSEASQFFTDIDAEVPPGPPDVEQLRAIGNRYELKFAKD